MEYLERTIKALHVPADGTAGLHIEILTIQQHLKMAGFKWAGRINTSRTEDLGFAAAVDDDGHAKGLQHNVRLQFFTDYPMSHSLVGNAFLHGETHDPFEGISYTDLSPAAETWLRDSARREEFDTWRIANPGNPGNSGLRVIRLDPSDNRSSCLGHPGLGDLTEYCDGSCGNTIDC